MSLKNLIRQQVIGVSEGANVFQASQMMKEKNVGDVLVWEKGTNRPIGIITDRDLALALADRNFKGEATPVTDIMTKNVILGSIDDGIFETIQKMRTNGIRRLPIIDKNDEVIGIISSDDLLKLMAEEILNLSQIIDFEIQEEQGVPQTSEQELIDQQRSPGIH